MVVAHRLFMQAQTLEDDLHGDLKLARRRGSVLLRIRLTDRSELRLPNHVSERCRVCARIQEMSVIENVVTFKPQFRLHAFGYAHALGDGRVPIPEARTIKPVPAIVGRRAERRICESAWIGKINVAPEGRCSPAGCSGAKRVTHLVRPCADPRSLRILGAANVEWMSGLRRENSTEFEALHHTTQCAGIHLALAAAKRQLPNIVNHSHMASIVVGVSIALPQISRVPRKSSRPNRGRQRINR